MSNLQYVAPTIAAARDAARAAEHFRKQAEATTYAPAVLLDPGDFVDCDPEPNGTYAHLLKRFFGLHDEARDELDALAQQEREAYRRIAAKFRVMSAVAAALDQARPVVERAPTPKPKRGRPKLRVVK